MDDLIAFLNARLDEDEELARDRLCVNCRNPVLPLRSALGVTGYTHGREGADALAGVFWQGVRCPGRITGAEPVQNRDRALREVEAGRKFLAWYAATGDGAYLNAIQAKAAVYRDHPGYDPLWAPPA